MDDSVAVDGGLVCGDQHANHVNDGRLAEGAELDDLGINVGVRVEGVDDEMVVLGDHQLLLHPGHVQHLPHLPPRSSYFLLSGSAYVPGRCRPAVERPRISAAVPSRYSVPGLGCAVSYEPVTEEQASKDDWLEG